MKKTDLTVKRRNLIRMKFDFIGGLSSIYRYFGKKSINTSRVSILAHSLVF